MIDARRQETLAAALTVIATGNDVWAAVDPNAAGLPMIDVVVLRT